MLSAPGAHRVQESPNSSLRFCLSVPSLHPFLGAGGVVLRRIRTGDCGPLPPDVSGFRDEGSGSWGSPILQKGGSFQDDATKGTGVGPS